MVGSYVEAMKPALTLTLNPLILRWRGGAILTDGFEWIVDRLTPDTLAAPDLVDETTPPVCHGLTDAGAPVEPLGNQGFRQGVGTIAVVAQEALDAPVTPRAGRGATVDRARGEDRRATPLDHG